MDETDASLPADSNASFAPAGELVTPEQQSTFPAPDPAAKRGVIVATDIFRFAHSDNDVRPIWHQRHNATWMHAIVRAMLAAEASIVVELLDHEALGLDAGFGPGADDCPNDWWRVAITSPIEADLARRLGDAVDGKVIVAFEIPETMRAIIDAHAHAVLNVSVSPLRFLDDIPAGSRERRPDHRRCVVGTGD